MADAVLVLDDAGRVLDANPAAAGLLGAARAGLLGRAVTDVLAGLGAREVSVSTSAVTDVPGSAIATIVVLRDVTERTATDRRLRTLLDEQTRLTDVLRQSLLPATLPEIAGLRLAARFLPAPGGDVGGDFYDVHPTDDGCWAFVLGDVVGKGVHAAVLTSRARYAVRTLSAQGWRPREVLEQLNRLLLSPEDPERFCTVLYGQVDTGGALDTGGAGGAGGVGGSRAARVVLALGGHPPPLLRRRDGAVHPVGVPGTVLGLQRSVRLHEVALDLYEGDVLLGYTDGVVEARSQGRFFGEAGLAEVLRRLPEPDADGAADAVLAALADFAPATDDAALLALAVTDGARTGPR